MLEKTLARCNLNRPMLEEARSVRVMLASEFAVLSIQAIHKWIRAAPIMPFPQLVGHEPYFPRIITVPKSRQRKLPTGRRSQLNSYFCFRSGTFCGPKGSFPSPPEGNGVGMRAGGKKDEPTKAGDGQSLHYRQLLPDIVFASRSRCSLDHSSHTTMVKLR